MDREQRLYQVEQRTDEEEKKNPFIVIMHMHLSYYPFSEMIAVIFPSDRNRNVMKHFTRQRSTDWEIVERATFQPLVVCSQIHFNPYSLSRSHCLQVCLCVCKCVNMPFCSPFSRIV